MHRGACHFHASLQHLLMHLQAVIPHAAEGGDQGRMDIHDPIGKFRHHLRRDPHQESRQHHQIRRQPTDLCGESLVEGLPVRIAFGGDDDSRNAAGCRPLQRFCPGIVADDGNDLPVGDPALLHGIQDCLEIRAPSGHAHYDLQHMSTPFSPALQEPTTYGTSPAFRTASKVISASSGETASTIPRPML